MTVLRLPVFTNDGVLPPGDYPLTLEQLRQSFLAQPRADNPNWDHKWRFALVDNLEILAMQLWSTQMVGRIFIDGSFVEDKDHPSDIDGYFECDRSELMSGQLEQALNLLDPHKVWTWSQRARLAARGFPKLQLPMWHRYRVELYPHYGATSGIKDEHGNDQTFPAAFRWSRDRRIPKGIIELIR